MYHFKQKITDQAGDDRGVEGTGPLEYLNNFWRHFEMPQTNCEINLILTWSANCAKWSNDIASTVTKTVTKLYIPVVTLLDEDKA